MRIKTSAAKKEEKEWAMKNGLLRN
jgi:hypothetical protein